MSTLDTLNTNIDENPIGSQDSTVAVNTALGFVSGSTGAYTGVEQPASPLHLKLKNLKSNAPVSSKIEGLNPFLKSAQGSIEDNLPTPTEYNIQSSFQAGGDTFVFPKLNESHGTADQQLTPPSGYADFSSELFSTPIAAPEIPTQPVLPTTYQSNNFLPDLNAISNTPPNIEFAPSFDQPILNTQGEYRTSFEDSNDIKNELPHEAADSQEKNTIVAKPETAAVAALAPISNIPPVEEIQEVLDPSELIKNAITEAMKSNSHWRELEQVLNKTKSPMLKESIE